MENQLPDSVPRGVARQQLLAAREARDASVRRALAPAGAILALSVFCGLQTVAPAYRGPGNAASIIAGVLLVAALVTLSARNQWRPLLSLPTPKWGVAEAGLICVALLVGGVVGPHLLASHNDSALASWGLGAAVTVIVAACLFAAQASYRRRASRAW